MHIDYFSFIAGMALLSVLAGAVFFGYKAGTRGLEQPSGSADLLNAVNGLADVFRKSSPEPDPLLCPLMDVAENTRDTLVAIRQIGIALTNPQRSSVDYENLEKIIAPLKESLFRIAADTELGKKKFDVLAKILGVDERVDYKRYIEENPEDEDKAVFQEAVQSLMRRQGLSYQQATSEMKSQMAHRSVSR